MSTGLIHIEASTRVSVGPAGVRGVVVVDGHTVWTCTHNHYTTEGDTTGAMTKAIRCAEREIKRRG